MYKRYGNKLMCFSPPVMLATFLLEFGLIFYTLFRYKLTPISRLVVSMLFFLGVFQLTEYMICGGLGVNHATWARMGYVSITILPVLGVHLVLAIAGKHSRRLLLAAYGSAAAFMAYFLFIPGSVVSDACSTNYAVFHMEGLATWLYCAYYYGWLLAASWMAMSFAGKKKIAPALRWLLIGYVSFIVPTTIANLADPRTLSAIPSVMCGFAVIFALILAFRVLPLSTRRRKS